ncbi:MAG: hypothetical protein FWH11_13450 [Micrococcales bacterium]|nr:hypothetical protein [Micrococcales bacterium]
MRRILWGDANGDGWSDEDEGLRGQAIMAFKDYVRQVEDAVYACDLIVQLVDASLGAEAELWDQARYAATQTVHRMAGTCWRLARAGAAGSADIDVRDVVAGIAFALGAVSLVPGPHQTAAGVSSLALSAVTASGYPGAGDFRAADYVNPPRPSIPHYHGALEVLELLLNGSKNSVDESVTIAEKEIGKSLNAAHHMMTVSERQLFNPRVAPVTEVPATLRHDRELALEIVRRTALVSVELCSAAVEINAFKDLGDASIMKRDPRIGTGQGTGPYHQLNTLLFFLGLALQEIGNEAYAASVNLHAVVEALDLAEVERQELIQATANSLTAADTGYVAYYSNEANIPLDGQVDVPEPVIPDIDRMRGERF